MRYKKLDGFRGVTIISMVLFHAMWDINYIFGVNIGWYNGTPGYIWQQSICWSFILLSGFCSAIVWKRRKEKNEFGFNKKGLIRALEVFGGGALVSIITVLAMPDDAVIFGVLTFIGSCKLIEWAGQTLYNKCRSGRSGKPWNNGKPGKNEEPEKKRKPEDLSAKGCILLVALFFLLFAMTRHISQGFVGIPSDLKVMFEEFIRADDINMEGTIPGLMLKVPALFYRNYFTTFFGFPFSGFYSTDYFPLLPWFFLYMTGYFLYGVIGKFPLMEGLRDSLCDSLCTGSNRKPATAADHMPENGVKDNQDILPGTGMKGKPAVSFGSCLCGFLEWLGRKSLVVYMLHQPVIYGVLTLYFMIF